MTHDPLTDPRPGDVVKIQEGWTRSVEARLGHVVKYRANYYDNRNAIHLISLVAWMAESSIAEVLHVAD